MNTAEREPGSDDDEEMTTIGDVMRAMKLGARFPHDAEVEARVAETLERMAPVDWVDAGGAARRDEHAYAIAAHRKQAEVMRRFVVLTQKARDVRIDLGLDIGTLDRQLELAEQTVTAHERCARRLEQAPPSRMSPAGALFAHVGAIDRACKLCGATIWLVKNRADKDDAFNGDGSHHALSCNKGKAKK